MEQVTKYYKKFVTEGFDENGILNKFEVNCPDNYNFGYDIIDKYGELEPDRPALLHVDLQENVHKFSYKQLSELSTQAANLFISKGTFIVYDTSLPENVKTAPSKLLSDKPQ